MRQYFAYRCLLILVLFAGFGFKSQGLEPSDCGHLPGFEPLSLVAKGGMGVIYRTLRVGHGVPIAIKMLSHSNLDVPEYRIRFRHEFDIMRRLSHHPNVAHVFEYGIEGNMLYMAMELVDGRNLKQKLDQDGPMSSLQVAEIFLQVTDALTAMQQAGIAAHRDVKLHNIMTTDSGQVKILDFGLARLKDDPILEAMEGADEIFGTAYYVAPEMILKKSERKGDIRSDLFSMGICMYEMLTGGRPFEARDTEKVLNKIIRGDFIPLTTYYPDVHPQMVTIVHTLMAHDPNQRFQNAQHVSMALKLAIRSISHTP